MRDFLRTTLLVTGMLVGLGAPAHADKTFNIGSLIIPTSAAYQSECGAVASYGLVYNVLRANAYLEANKATICPTLPFGKTCKIEIYYSVKSSKMSPNRCTPTNLDAGPAYTGVAAPVHTDPNWNDGCDFEITSSSMTPVKLVNNTTNPPSVTTDTNVVTRNTSAEVDVFPRFSSRTVDFAAGARTVRYLGGPFIIDATDAPLFMKLLSGSQLASGILFAKDSANNNVDFTPFRTGSEATCAFGTTVGGYVNVHRAAVVFTAPAAKEFTSAPPRVALLATTSGAVTTNIQSTSTKNIETTGNNGARKSGAVVTIKTTRSHGFAVGDFVVIAGVTNTAYNTGAGNAAGVVASTPSTTTFTINTGSATVVATSGGGTVTRVGAFKVTATGVITVKTSANHLLNVGDSITVADVDVGGYNANWTVASIPDARTITINTGALTTLASSGNGDVTRAGVTVTRKVSDGILQVYLRNAGLEFPGAGGCPPGGLNATNPAKCPAGGVRGQIYDTFDIADITSGKLDTNYKMIWTPHWETIQTGSPAPTAAEASAVSKISQFLDGQTGLMAECHSIEAFEGAYSNGSLSGSEKGDPVGQFQTCVKSGATCSSTTTTPYGMNKNATAPTTSGYWPNCSDPARPGGAFQANGDDCTYFGYPGDAFAQPGDFIWNNQSGSVRNYQPNAFLATPTMYRPGVLALISGVTTLDKTKLADPITARTMISADYASRNQKDNLSTKANILYMAGHDVSGVVSGTKVILQTLLLLGEPPINTTTEEVTRSSPIITSIGPKTAVVQGTFELLNPAGSTFTADNDAQVATFKYPDLFGHLRAVETSDIGVRNPDATKIKNLTTLFDAAEALPSTASSYNPGCGSSSFGLGNCRTVFTHTATGLYPTIVKFETGSASNAALKAAINIGGGTINTAFPTFMQRIIAGVLDGGAHVARLGGVDRSTIAAVPSSLVAGTARPKVIYFGGTDGMLHAVCASLTGPCDTLGRELWAFIPRTQLPYLRKNTARIDGSPRVIDVFADLGQDGNASVTTRSFRTLLVFQTAKGDGLTPDQEPSMTALDITDPTAPKIVWEYVLPGQGLVVNVGRVSINGSMQYLAFAQTNAAGAAPGNVVTAVNVETGALVWKTGGPVVGSPYLYNVTAPARGLTTPPITAIPGGAVGVDTQGTGNITDVVFGTIYGDIWQVDAATGVSRQGANPLFQFTTDKHPFGAPLTIFGDGGPVYALGVPGGYADLAAGALWSASDQSAVAVRLSPKVTSGAPLSESSTVAAGLKFKLSLGAGDKSYSQATVVGGQVFITTDSLDPNATGYGGAAGDTGKVLKVNLNQTGALTSSSDATVVVVTGGASSIATSGTSVFNVSKNSAEQLGTSMNASTSGGTSVSSTSVARVSRKLWLRTL
ncbi:MAG: hypothetical protein JWP01_820 [Myxococcales bacterium]|nr:hypothetical protein [Myxococcales bacterium]